MTKKTTPTRDRGRWATGLLAVIGIGIAWYLTEFHIQAAVGDAVGGALCDAHAVVDCDSAVHSDYAELFGIPISLLGLSFYVAVVGLVLFDREKVRTSSAPYRPAAIAATTFGFGSIYSLVLAGISAFELQTLCPFCAMLYGVNFAGLVAASYWAGKPPHRLVIAQLKRPRTFFNGWTGFFALLYAVALAGGMSVVGAEIDNRIAADGRQAVEAAEETYRIDDAPAKGPEEAPIRIVEFSSFGCPYCGELAKTLEELTLKYPEAVRVEYRHFPPDRQPQGHLASRASYCADQQDAFWEMHALLYTRAPRHDRDSIDEYAEEIGLDMGVFDWCIDSDEAHEHVDRDIADGGELGIQGTPTFFVNGERIEGVVPYEELERMVEDHLQQ